MITANDIEHGFALRAHDLIGLFADVNKMSQFMYRLERQSIKDVERYDPFKYVGDGFEFFTEIFLKSHSFDNRVGISNYEPVQSDDNGVDGVGINLIGEKCAVQCKYRSNNIKLLTANEDHLGNMVVDAMMKFNITKPPDNKTCPRYYVVTTAKGLHHYTDNEFFKGYVKCFGIGELKSMLDGNIQFWNLCREITKDIVTQNLSKQPKLKVDAIPLPDLPLEEVEEIRKTKPELLINHNIYEVPE